MEIGFFLIILIVVIFIIKSKSNAEKNDNYYKSSNKGSSSRSAAKVKTAPKPAPIPIKHSNCRFNTEKMQESKDLFLIAGSQIEIATQDILSLNPLIKPLGINRSINKEKLRFGNIRAIETNCHVATIPRTPSGKSPKYPQKLCFFTTDHGFDVKDDLFGTIYYLKDGSIGKADMVIWDNDVCYSINFALISGKLALNIAYKQSAKDAVKIQIYKAAK